MADAAMEQGAAEDFGGGGAGFHVAALVAEGSRRPEVPAEQEGKADLETAGRRMAATRAIPGGRRPRTDWFPRQVFRRRSSSPSRRTGGWSPTDAVAPTRVGPGRTTA